MLHLVLPLEIECIYCAYFVKFAKEGYFNHNPLKPLSLSTLHWNSILHLWDLPEETELGVQIYLGSVGTSLDIVTARCPIAAQLPGIFPQPTVQSLPASAYKDLDGKLEMRAISLSHCLEILKCPDIQ